MSAKKPLLTISLLISDRLDTIPRCLDSLRLIMEELPCELILTDTSKNPAVREVLQKYTDQIYEFEWCNDFSKARNVGIEHAKGEWFLYIDDDEWFVEVDEIINFFKSGEYKEYGYANFIIRNFLDENYITYSDCWTSRMVRLEDSVKFVSKIHEYFLPPTEEGKNLFAIANHSGYIYDSQEKREARFQRNYPLLLEMIEKEPNHLRWHIQLTQEYVSVCKWNELKKFCEECLEFIKKEDTYGIRNNIGTFYEGIILALINQEKYQECITVCKRALEDRRAEAILKGKMHFRLAECYLNLKKYTDASKNIEKYLQIFQSLNRNTEDILEQESAALVGDAFEEKHQISAYLILICSELGMGNLDSLIKYYEKLCWDRKIIYVIDGVEKYMVKAMWTQEYHPVFLQIILDVLANSKLSEKFRKEVLLQDNTSINEFQSYVYDLAKSLQTLIEGPLDEAALAYYSAMEAYVSAVCQWSDFLETEKENAEAEFSAGYIQAAMKMCAYMELENQNKVEALRKLKEAVELMPELASGIETYISLYAELDRQRSNAKNEEMQNLRRQIIGQVQMMLSQGQKQEALQIIEQLMQMFPGDQEIEGLHYDR